MRTPHDDIRAGLLLVRHGLSDLREDYERAAAEQDLRRALAVDTEAQLRALSGEAYRAKRYRHLQPGELSGPRRPPSDLRSAVSPAPPPKLEVDPEHQQEVGDFDPREAVTVAPALDAVTARSLRDMGLAPGARWASTPPAAKTWRNLWGLVQG